MKLHANVHLFCAISGKKKKHKIHTDAALQEAQDIFGVDFDFDEFEQFGEEEYDEDEEDEVRYRKNIRKN